MPTPLRVLVIEDSLADTELLLHTLKKGGFDPILHERVDNGPDMEAALARQKWDVVVSDHHMPRFSAANALDTLKNNGYDMPFFIVSGQIDESLAADVM